MVIKDNNVVKFMDLSEEEIENEVYTGPVKTCIYCKHTLPITAFPPKGNVLDQRCRDCKNQERRDGTRRTAIKEATHGHPTNCEICNTDIKRKKGSTVDHNHKTGAIRGYLCNRCNTLLGKMGDDKENIIAKVTIMLDYLDQYDIENSPEFLDSIRKLNERFLS